ncbi:fimbrial protein [Pseudomonas sp. RL_15y_Pfl2_60]|uniref:fimbrial protein n=1 Tax=Pseudomonas sp. RL_15y_Pfl2_60 TaxID=3088709 RepID=UPI0030D84376
MSGNSSTYRTFIRAQAGLCLAIMLALVWSSGALADLPAWQCEGTPVIEQNNTINMDMIEASQAGQTTNSTFDTGQQGTGFCNCPTSGSYTSYFTATSTLPESGGWLRLNDELEAQVYIFVYGPGDLQVPFDKKANIASSPCSPTSGTISLGTGRRGKIVFRLTQNLVGETTFSGRLANLYWQIGNSSAAVDLSYPAVHVNADITLRAIASCQFRAGDTFSIDLGDIDKAALTEGGMPKSGYTPKSIDLSLDCINVGSSGKVNYMFQSASGSEGNLLLTDLRGLGIGLRDGDDNPVGLGAENSIDVPVISNTTSFLLKPYPTKVGKAAVESGRYTTQAIVTVSVP